MKFNIIMKICMHLANFATVKFKTPFGSATGKFMTVTKINRILVIVFNYIKTLNSRCLATICSNLAGEFVLVNSRQPKEKFVRSFSLFSFIFTNLSLLNKKLLVILVKCSSNILFITKKSARKVITIFRPQSNQSLCACLARLNLTS